jgi:hypothetical protein
VCELARVSPLLTPFAGIIDSYYPDDFHEKEERQQVMLSVHTAETDLPSRLVEHLTAIKQAVANTPNPLEARPGVRSQLSFCL